MANHIESGCVRRVVLLLVEGLGVGGELGSPPQFVEASENNLDFDLICA